MTTTIPIQKKRMRKITVLFAALLIFHGAYSLDSSYHYSIDLTKTDERMLSVELIPPHLTEGKIIFSMPKMVPGTYSIYDFGRFVEDFRAYDLRGKEMAVNHTDVNSWEIDNAENLAKISYKARDTYHADKKDNPVFEPAGTDLEKDTCYLLNLHTMLGYFRGHTKQSIELTIDHKTNFYGSTSLVDIDKSSEHDRYLIGTYNEAVDNPIMYSVPDTAHIRVGTSDILISLYSPGHKSDAKTLATLLDTMLQDQGKYLGGKLPVDKYSFLIYLAKREGLSGSFGALEHSYGSMYYLIDGSNETLAPTMRDVASHEFFHIVTPLNIHSYEIADFDFDQPQMSEHLWLYEGTTEYHAHKMQVQYGLISPQQYLRVIKQKAMEAMFGFNDSLSFTEMSKGCLDTFKDQYNNVYSKGMLISLCLDLKLLHLSRGKYSIMNLIQDLAKNYGKDKAFKDEELIPKVVSLTYPEIKTFFDDYVIGHKELPMEECLAYAGVDYKRIKTVKTISLGQCEISYSPEAQKMYISSLKNINDFGRAMGYQKGDLLVKMNGKKIAPTQFRNMREKWYVKAHEGETLRISILRINERGRLAKKVLKAKVFKSDTRTYNVIKFEEKPNEEQQLIKKAWLEAQ
jgi:predicted metalloprotease with PDZ domain